MAKLVVLVLAAFLHKTASMHECCNGDNRISEDYRLCSDNSSINLKCGEEIDVVITEGYTIYEVLTPDSTFNPYGPDKKYCNGTLEDSKTISIICVNISQFDYPQNSFIYFREKTLVFEVVVMYVSGAFAILTMLLYLMVPSLLDLQGKCTMHVLAGTASSSIFLATILIFEYDTRICAIVPYLTYVSFVYMFLWLSILSFHIWRTTVKPCVWETAPWLAVYHMVGIGGTVAALLVILLTRFHSSVDVRPGFAESSCWFESKRQTWIYYYGPISILLATNVMFYVWTLLVMSRRVNNSRSKTLKYRLKLCVRLCVIMGINWWFDVLTFAINPNSITSMWNVILLLLLDLYSSCQGILFFLVLVVFRRSVRRGLASRNFCMIRFPDSWKYLKDEEVESAEEMANSTTVRYTKRGNLQATEQLNS